METLMPWTTTAGSWRTVSKQGKFWRSSEFNKIETAIGKYKTTDPNDARLKQLKAILDAISHWRIHKQEQKAKKAGVAFVSPKDARDEGAKIAQAENRIPAAVRGGDNETLSVRSQATDSLVADVVAEIDVVMTADRTAWGVHNFTAPTQQALGEAFRFLVTAQTETADVVAYREATILNPALIQDALISASVIQQDSIHVWGPSGFILNAPTNCIGVAMADDFKTKNAVAEGHQLEKYREILRLYESGVRLPAPTALRAATGKHSEVAVLGRSYGHTTSVSGIFVLVNAHANSVAEIRPASVYHIASLMTKQGTTQQIQVIGATLPAVTDRRMAQYRQLNADLGIPIVQLPLSASVELGATYWQGLYGNAIVFLNRPANAMVHGSDEHRAAVASGEYQVTIKDDHPKNCNICKPPA